MRLVATDFRFSAGIGPHIEGPAEALLMTIANRHRVVSELSVSGQAKLADPIGS